MLRVGEVCLSWGAQPSQCIDRWVLYVEQPCQCTDWWVLYVEQPCQCTDWWVLYVKYVLRIPQSPIEPGNYTVTSSYFQFCPSQNAFYLESSDETSDFQRHYRVFRFEIRPVVTYL